MILPPQTLGMIGGGQLGRMFAMAARTMGYRVMVLDPDLLSPAAEFANEHLAAAYTDPAALEKLGTDCAAVTTEFENAPAAVLTALAASTTVRPSGGAVAIAQDRHAEKSFFTANGFPVGPFAIINGPADIEAALTTVKLPAILKTARFGYDGKGQARINTPDALAATLAAWKFVPAILEAFIDLKLEISVVLARGADGEIAVFPIAENQHVNGILDITIVPARISQELAERATAIARNVAVALDYVGVLAVEFFITQSNDILINEMAPRPHNSGHVTIDACRSSQFEQQVRALCGLPLGDPSLHTPAVMFNLLGDVWPNVKNPDHKSAEPAWQAVLKHPGAHLHLYGKREARIGRKMGHITVCDADLNRALSIALEIRHDLQSAK